MDGLYLASNIGPLKTIGNGKAFIAINDLLNTDRFENVELVAYSIEGNDGRIIRIECLLKKEGLYGPTIYFRNFEFYKSRCRLEDSLKLTADYGVGFGDYDLQNFIKLRDFYFQNKEVPAEV
ncbi:hypothetical protein [Neobacillus drentensis]|uniref:hypothetical protein n=1 Tax=Neobacillus drentensis TaxID=220684 RepID=UPI002862E3CC|nr:hypothetical protein [Neobacillus drentensis]MDR7237170.1 hypothetical protein [Neobacillus drentensis]